MAFTSGNDRNFIEGTGRVNVDAGAGDDLYIIDSAGTSSTTDITIGDTAGANRLQLAGGLAIASSVVASNTLQLTLSNGAKVTLLNAASFTFFSGGTIGSPTGTGQTYAQFAAGTLGVATIPTTGTTAGAAVTVGGTTGGGGGTTTGGVTVTSAASTVTEGQGMTFTVTRTDSTAAATYTYSVSGDTNGGTLGNASATDFTAVSGTVTLAAGATTGTFTVTAAADTTVEGLEGFKVTLFDANLAAVATSSVKAVQDDPNVVQNQTFTLTVDPNAFTGGNGDDTFIATEATLSSADALAGGDGTDTIRYTSSGNAAVNEAGFTATNVERVQVTSDAVGGTTFDVTGVTGLNTITNTNSSNNLVFDGLGALAALEITGISGGNTTVNYRSTVVAGTADTQNITVGDNVTNAGAAVGNLTINGIETMAITSNGGTSIFTGVASDKLSTITVGGSSNLNLGTVNFQGTTSATATAAGNTLNASAFKGNLTVTLGNNSATTDISVVGGSGNDRVDFGASYDKLDAFTGGDGTDTVAMTNAVATGIVATDSGSVSGVEVLGITDAGTGTVTLTNFAGVSRVNYETGLGGATIVTKAPSAVTVGVFNVNTVAQNLTVNVATDGAADAVTIELHDIAATDVAGTLTTTTATSDYETVNLVVRDDAKVDGIGTVTVANIVTTGGTTALQFATAMTIDTNANLNITAATTNIATGNTAGDVNGLTSLDASASTGNIDASALDYQAVTTNSVTAGATIKMGSGNDTVIAGNGVDTITLGAGKDVVYYTTVAQSDRDMDTITDFQSGDIINIVANAAGTLTNWGAAAGTFTSTAQFAGNRATFAEAQGALAGKGSGTATVNAVFQVDTNTLWVDANGDGTLDNNDFRVKLNNVTTLSTTDLGFGSGNSSTLSAPAAVVNLTTKTNASAVTTPFDDGVTSSIANLVGSAVDATSGTDTLTISDAGAVTVPAGFTNFESLVLANGSNTAVAINAANGFKNITGGTGPDSVALTNLVAGGAVNLGGGADALTAATEAIIEGVGSTFVGGTSSTNGAVDVDTLTFSNALTTATLDLSAVSGFETIDLGTVAAGGVTVTAGKFASGVTTLKADTANGAVTVNLTAAQLDALTTVTVGTGGNAFNLVATDKVAYTINLADTTYTTLANVSLIDLSAGVAGVTATIKDNLAVTFGAGADTLNVTGAIGAASTIDLAGGVNIVNVNVADGIVSATDIASTGSTANVLNLNAVVTTAALSIQNAMDIFATVNSTVDQGTTNAITINNAATTVTSVGGAFILGTGGDKFTSSGTAANIVTSGTGADTITFGNTLGNTVNLNAGLDTVNLNATNGVTDTLALNDGAGTVGLVLAANRFAVNGFGSNDVIRLDTAQTTAGTAAGAQPVIQSVSSTGALLLASNTADITILNFDMGGSTAVLAGVLNGAALLANLGGALTARAGDADDGYILAYDNGNAYLYAYTNATSAGVLAAEIVLIGVINGVAVGSIGAANFGLGT